MGINSVLCENQIEIIHRLTTSTQMAPMRCFAKRALLYFRLWFAAYKSIRRSMTKPKMTCTPSEDSDQPAHPRMKKPCFLIYPLNAQWRLIRLGGSEFSLGAHVQNCYIQNLRNYFYNICSGTATAYITILYKQKCCSGFRTFTVFFMRQKLQLFEQNLIDIHNAKWHWNWHDQE